MCARPRAATGTGQAQESVDPESLTPRTEATFPPQDAIDVGPFGQSLFVDPQPRTIREIKRAISARRGEDRYPVDAPVGERGAEKIQEHCRAAAVLDAARIDR